MSEERSRYYTRLEITRQLAVINDRIQEHYRQLGNLHHERRRLEHQLRHHEKQEEEEA